MEAPPPFEEGSSIIQSKTLRLHQLKSCAGGLLLNYTAPH